MSDRPARRLLRTIVEEVRPLTPQMTRVIVGGEALRGFGAGEFTDHYVKLQLPPPGADYDSDFDPEEIRDTRPREYWPRTRTYSVRDWDPGALRLTIDFVVHGDSGVAGPWASTARPGDVLLMTGPGGGYAPDPEADWHLLAGDAAVIPAISASLPRISPGVPVFVVVEVDGPEEELPLTTPGDLRLQWLHRTAPPGESELLVDAIAALELPPGEGQAFVHGEATAVRNVRRHLLIELGMPPEAVSATGYWKARATEEGWREYKPEWKRLAAADVGD